MGVINKAKEQYNAVIYARYSSHGQQDQSIDGQLRDCYTFAEREGITIIGEYIDRAISGKTDERPDFQRMVSDSAKKQFEVVLVWKLDRFARNRYDSAHYKSRLKKHGVKVVSATENITNDPEGIILEGLLESMAEYYSANLSKHVKRGQRETIIKGNFVGGRPIIGYKVENKKLVIDEDKAPIIKYAFEQYADGVSKKEIIRELNARGALNSFGKPLSLTSFQYALQNKKYIGIYVHGGQEVTGGCPALIDERTFYAVQERLSTVKHAPAAKKAKEEYLLQGKAYCGKCGARLVGEMGTSRTGTTHHYYACGKKKKHHTCDKLNEKKGFLEWYVVEQAVKYVLNPERMEIIAERVVASYEKEFGNSHIKELEKRIQKIEWDVNKLIDLILNSPARAAVRITERIESLETQKVDAENELSQLRILSRIRYTKEQIIAWLESFYLVDFYDVDFQRRVIDIFINSVYLYDNKTVIFFNVKEGKQISYIEMLESTEEPSDYDGPTDVDMVRISNESPCCSSSRESLSYRAVILVLPGLLVIVFM